MRATILHGSCEAHLRTLADCSIDAVVTDPPAGIGFMGREWDSDKGGRDQWIAWLAGVMRECLRVLRPGGYALVWALPRTSHWTATAIEDAGFEIRDVHHHIFGCVPLETEILTERGWITYDQLALGENVVQVDERGRASLGPLERVSVYPFDGEMCRIATRSTEQMLTPGHKVHAYARRGKWKRIDTDETMTMLDAEEIVGADRDGVAGWQLPLGARGADVRGSLESADVAAMYGWVITEGNFQRDTRAVNLYQNEGPKADEIRALLRRLDVPHSEYRRTRDDYDGTPRENVQWYIKVGPWAERLLADLAGDKPTPPAWLAWLPEEQARALFEALVDGDGSRNKSNTSGAWYQKRPEVRAWFQSLCFRLGYRSTENASKSAVQWSCTDSTEVQRGFHRKRWSSRMPYSGEVWCPTVPQGRWVARYRGNVFVTGNTGFPKSLNMSKALDAHELIGRSRPEDLRRLVQGGEYEPSGRGSSLVNYDHGCGSAMNGSTRARSPATPNARRWQGHGTALKPAVEHWILARRPLEGTYAENVLEHGTGALRIDACRIGTDDSISKVGLSRKSSGGILNVTDEYRESPFTQHALGRWPAHLSLEHADSCREVGTVLQSEHCAACGWSPGDPVPHAADCVGKMHRNFRVAWQCVDGCPVRTLDEQSGESRSTRGKPRGSAKSGDGWGMTATGAEYDDTGGASRFFHTVGNEPGFRYIAKPARSEKDRGLEDLPAVDGGAATGRTEGSAGLKSPRAGSGRNGGGRNMHPTVKAVALMRWLVRLITPPGGLVLDPFAGSGTTGVACAEEGLRFVGMEQDEKHHETARLRLRKAFGAADVATTLPAQRDLTAVLTAQPVPPRAS